MGVGLMPLEFKDCLTDSPAFRENLSKHEKELEKTSQQIKRLIKEVKDLLSAAKNLSRAQRTLSNSLRNFTFECIGSSQTEDEKVISQSLEQFGLLIARIEEERENMLERASEQIVLPLEKFRKERIGDVKEGKKKFDKKSTKFCQIQEKTINLSTRKQDNVLLEADASLGMAERDFCQASLEYVFRLQEVQERKKFEFVETLLGFMYGWLTFYHQGHEVAKDFKPFMSDLQLRIQKTRENFNETHDKTESLMKKMMEIRQAEYKSEYARVGYLFLMEKRAFNTHWTKQYCMYSKSTKQFKMIAFNQLTGKPAADTDSMTLTSCVRRMSDTIEKRFCFDLMSDERPGVVYTLQALSESDRKAWMDVMDGKEPTYAVQGKVSKPEECLDDIGFTFVTRCIEILESRGLEELGLYRVTGVASKVNKLLSMGLDRRKVEERVGLLNSLEDGLEWESKTITSALKTYLRTLREPIMTHRYHNGFIAAAKQESRDQRICDVHTLVHRIPKQNFEMLDIVIKHLTNVAAKSVKNLMTVSNLAVCFGPTLLRPEEETVASIMDIKFYNVVVEMLIDNYELIFKILPEEQDKNSPNADTRSYNPNHSSSLDSPVSLSNQSSPLGSGSPSAPSGTPPAPQRNSLAHTARYQNVPNVTHAVIRSYDIEPMSSSLHNVAAVNEPRANGIAYLMSHSEHVSRSDHITRTDMNNRMIMAPHRINPATVAAYSEGNLHKMQAHSPKNKHLPYSGLMNERADVFNSTSSSNESMSSGSSRELGGHGVHHSNNIQYSSGVSPQKNRRGVAPLPSHYPAGYRSPATISSIFGASSSGRASPHSPVPSVRRVRTLYACLGENDGELSFEPNQIITNVKSSLEPGWLEGTLNGKTGLVPENYVEMLQ